MTEAFVIIGYIVGLFGLIATIAGAVVVSKSTTARSTIEVQNQNIQSLFDKLKLQDRRIAEQDTIIAKLQGELDAFKSVPLSQIAQTQADTHQLLLQGGEIIDTIAKNQKIIMNQMKIEA